MSVSNGEQAPAFTLEDAAESARHELATALQQGPVVLGFYKSSCGASKIAFPFLERIYRAYPKDRLTVWGVAQDSANITRSFAQREGVTFPMLIDDPGYDTSRDYDIPGTPTIFLIDPSGKVAWQDTEFHKSAMDDLSGRVASLLEVEKADVISGTDDVPDSTAG